MSNEKAGCGRIPLVSESRLKIAALSSDPGNSFRGFWHCAEILTFSLLPSRASRWRREHVPRQQASTAVSPTTWAHTGNCTPQVFQNQPIFLSVMTFAFGWLTLTIELHSSRRYIQICFWSVEDCSQPSSSLKKGECQIGLHFKQVPN